MKKYSIFAVFACFFGVVSAENLNIQLHDGRSMQVERLIAEKREGRWGDPFFGLPINPRVERVGDVTKLTFTNPKTREIINWQSEPDYTPLILDFFEDVPYLVIHGTVSKNTQSVYGCPELPYFFLEYGSGYSGGWKPIPYEEAPEFLREANLPVPRINDGGSIQATIPRNYDEWKYKYKNNHRYERNVWDFRPLPPGPPDVALPKPTDVELKLVESVDIDALDGAIAELRLKPRVQSRRNCNSAFQIADPVNPRSGRRFTRDSTGSKVVPFAGPSPIKGNTLLDFRTSTYCDVENIWFVAAKEEDGKVHVTKYTRTGDLLYNVRFMSPPTYGPNLVSEMVLDTFEVENNEISFYWLQDYSIHVSGNQPPRFPAKLSKFIFTEPSAIGLQK